MGGAQGFGDFAGGFSDIFEEFFGGGFGGSSRQRGPQRGSDLRYNMSVTLQEAFAGKKSQIRIPGYESCDLCSATGSADKSGPSTCSTCGGHGKVRSTQGFFSIERPCPTCGGEGSSIKNPCLKCSGTGQLKNKRLYPYQFLLALIMEQEFEFLEGRTWTKRSWQWRFVYICSSSKR